MTEDLSAIVCEFCVHSRSSCLSSDLRSTVLCVCCSLGSACEAEVKVGAQLRFCVGEESTLSRPKWVSEIQTVLFGGGL